MGIREHLSSVTFAVLLTAGFVTWPTAAAAAGQSYPNAEKAARLEQAAAFQMERTEAKSSPLALRLYGGFSRAEAGDLNTGLEGFFKVLEFYRAAGFGTTTGGYDSPFRAGHNFGADLIFQVTRGIGLGIGAGYLRFSKSSLMALSKGSEKTEFSVDPTLTAIPIRLGLFLTLPLGKRLNLTVNGGAVAYAALKFDARERLSFSDGDVSETFISARGSDPFKNLGYQGSLGFEFMISRNSGIFIEALGCYARLKNFEKATQSSGTEGGSDATDGRLYLVAHTTTDGTKWNAFTVEETPPISRTPSIVYSEPKVDLSGFSLQAGLRIRL